jgi:plasmid replication initiation protein
LKLQVDDPADLLLAERMEHNHFIDTVQELRLEVMPQDFHQPVAQRRHVSTMTSARCAFKQLSAKKQHESERPWRMNCHIVN